MRAAVSILPCFFPPGTPAADYAAAKRQFCEALIELIRHWRAWDSRDSPIFQSIDLMISLATEEFINDPAQHYPSGHIGRFSYVMELERSALGLHEKKIVPPGFIDHLMASFYNIKVTRLRAQPAP